MRKVHVVKQTNNAEAFANRLEQILNNRSVLHIEFDASVTGDKNVIYTAFVITDEEEI